MLLIVLIVLLVLLCSPAVQGNWYGREYYGGHVAPRASFGLVLLILLLVLLL